MPSASAFLSHRFACIAATYIMCLSYVCFVNEFRSWDHLMNEQSTSRMRPTLGQYGIHHRRRLLFLVVSDESPRCHRRYFLWWNESSDLV